MARRRPRTTWIGVALSATALLAVTACSSDDSKDASATTSTTTAVSSSVGSTGTSGTTAATGTTVGAGCKNAVHGAVPAGFASRQMGDVDGDGKADTLFVGASTTGGKQYGVVTAGGITSTWTANDASGVDPSILGVVDSNQDGRPEIWVNPGRHLVILTVQDCTLQPYLNKQGQPYEFSIGFEDAGTGVGCIDANGDGKQDLVGLKRGADQAGKVPWTRTIVDLSGTHATNGATSSGSYTVGPDDAKIALLSEVTCGTDTFADPLSSQG